MKRLVIADVGPIKRVEVELPEPGGVLVFRGRNGTGKSHAIDGVAALTNRETRKRLRPRDGTTAGTIEAPGITVRIGRANTAKGQLELEMVAPECDISQLVDPGLKDALAADRQRLRTAVQLGAVEVAREQWALHVGDWLEPDVVESIAGGLDPSNPVGAAEEVRRRVHELALAAEKTAERLQASAEAVLDEIAGVDLSAPSNAADLQTAHQRAVELASRLEAERTAAETAQQAREQAVQQLASVEGSLPDLEAIESEQKAAELARFNANVAILNLEDQIKDLRSQVDQQRQAACAATTASEHARIRLQKGRQQHESVATLRDIVSRQVAAGPQESDLGAARQSREMAYEQMLAGDRIREALRAKQRAAETRQTAETAALRAKALRELAWSTDQVLEAALRTAGFEGLVPREGRIYVHSDRGPEGLELFDELSMGERWGATMRWLSGRLGRGGLVPLVQEAYESLDPQARQELARRARDCGLVVVTGEATDGPLVPVEYPVGDEG